MIVRLDDMCDMYELDKQDIFNAVALCKKSKKKYPKWYIYKDRYNIFIDINEYQNAINLEYDIWLYLTDELYWEFIRLGMTQLSLSKKMAERSSLYKDFNSWNSFFSWKLFAIPAKTITSSKRTMRIDFIAEGTRFLSDMIKGGVIDIRNEG